MEWYVRNYVRTQPEGMQMQLTFLPIMSLRVKQNINRIDQTIIVLSARVIIEDSFSSAKQTEKKRENIQFVSIFSAFWVD